eukprot:CAMPEP_0195599888 /NCGR_PEP_ID=MMETSP0815-20121206/4266_2 /TAXON_ID=97485 /ORGANISM="Prymnesium parvum, Strain Texoma1" /LENGTH=84 /DNA_ID=CAMNT_0040739341 /DNA_START=240 /DNA_END=494 /DNA_ORIENTATION=-
MASVCLCGSEILTQGQHPRFSAKRAQLCPTPPAATTREVLEINVVSQGHAASVDPQDLKPAVLVGRQHFEELIEPAGAHQRGID